MGLVGIAVVVIVAVIAFEVNNYKFYVENKKSGLTRWTLSFLIQISSHILGTESASTHKSFIDTSLNLRGGPCNTWNLNRL